MKKMRSFLLSAAISLIVISAFAVPVRAGHDTVTSHVVLVFGSVRGNIAGWAFGVVEDDPSTDIVVYSVFSGVDPVDREDLADLILLARTGATCTMIPVEGPECIVTVTHPDVTYQLNNLGPDGFILTFEFAP